MKATWSTYPLLCLVTTGCLVGPLDTDLGVRPKGTGGTKGAGGEMTGSGGSGGKPSSGGTESGGSDGTGGSKSGGADSGGSGDTGGRSSGGAETGGTTASGGSSGGSGGSSGGSGGAAAGGGSTGGDATGGDATGGGPTELLTNGGFEMGAGGWYTWGGRAVVSIVSQPVHGGSQSLKVTGGDTGPVGVNLLNQNPAPDIPPGRYDISFWMTVGDTQVARVQATMGLTCGAATTYARFAGPITVTGGVWSQLSGTVDILSTCDVTMFQPYVEGADPESVVDLYVDDVSVSY